ncbi:MAG: putative DNA binding domain-containing protein, partial [Calditrichaeota bacterium]|nr:putative DNA binding domain-containing protein [Calditrichota bacterium]
MTGEELDFILKKGEGYRIEFKERLNNSLAKEMCAFANGSGGKIFLGVKDNGEIRGCKLDNVLKSQIQNTASNCHPSIEAQIIEKSGTVIITIPESESKPVQCSDGFFLRQGPNSQKLNRDQIIAFLAKEGHIHWDEQIFSRFDFTVLYDPTLIFSFLKKTGIQTTLSHKDIFVNLGLIKQRDGRDWFTNAGFLFFGKLPELAPNFMEITCALYKGTDKVYILDRKDFNDDLISNIENTVQFVMRNTRMRAEIKGLLRKDIPEVPEVALRESIVNAVLHRDYSIQGARVMVEIYDDRIEISNPGGLPPSMTPEEFGRRSVIRNPNIANMLQRFGYIERMGTGIGRINELCDANGTARPAYDF